MVFAHLLEPRNPIPGQTEQAGSEVCELAILTSSTKARQQTRQRITHRYTKAHKQQQTDLFPSHPNFFWIFKCMLFVGSLFRTQRTFSKFGFVLHIRCPDNMKKTNARRQMSPGVYLQFKSLFQCICPGNALAKRTY